jgi:hypothetical protein
LWLGTRIHALNDWGGRLRCVEVVVAPAVATDIVDATLVDLVEILSFVVVHMEPALNDWLEICSKSMVARSTHLL